MENIRSWLIISQLSGVKVSEWLQRLALEPLHLLLESSPERLAQLGFDKTQSTQLLNPDERWLDSQFSWLEKSSLHHLVGFDDPDYPELLKQISNPPLVLYGCGDWSLVHQPQVGIVGSRNASRYGLDNAFNFAQDLSNNGLTVTSGLAIGIDAAAHRGALAGAASTIAVLGTGVDRVYPPRNKSLYDTIKNEGLLLSEFEPGTQVRSYFFPRRNRIISGLSKGVLVVEGVPKSGSLITARYAAEQNREVFAIPGSIHEVRSKGCHGLIKQGAKLVETTKDILDELQIEPKQTFFPFDDKKDEKNDVENFTSQELLVNLGNEVVSVDELVALTEQPIDKVLSQLLDLELQGLVAPAPGGYIRLRRE
ncbi:DNA-processing protein DprA [Gayadomonas joobiniege]|uniref:DNA-processing protein DprA n=1 Tax=Gayadomonas joobiniege TaxID=1234606 RepID=UPI00036994A4|nr:DNA-processing protein DprA [Gayadomonas joobiniege]